MKLGVVLALALAGCGRDRPPPSCAERVATLATRLAAERSLEEVRATAPPRLRRALDFIASGEAEVMTLDYKAVAAACPPLDAVLQEVREVEGSASAFLRARVPPAFEACQCRASPEEIGGQIEVVLYGWRTQTPPHD